MTYIHKSESHVCDPPRFRLYGGTYTLEADADPGSIWKCECGNHFVVSLSGYWYRVGFWDFAAKKRIKEYERGLLDEEWGGKWVK